MKNEFCFWNLLQTYKIKIPKIQRNYAQGRTDKKTKVLVDFFLNSIKTAIVGNAPLSLDFIYGKIEDNILIPIDGQQRLTTLFLLHWYFAVKENKLTENNKEILKKFTYQTRLSSIDFCEKLVDKGEEYATLFENDSCNEKISEKIKDSPWYFFFWKYDQTIVSMLNMIDKINETFKDVNIPLFEKLQGSECPITFYFLPMKEFKLTDELYIKMNARGKQLTSFENFKTLFSNYLELEDKIKLDNKWLDIFWNIEKEEAKKHKTAMNTSNVDKYYYRFFQNITPLFYAENHNIETEYIYDYPLFTEYQTVYNKDEYVKQTIYILDALASYKDDNFLFKNFLSDNSDYWDKIRFYALSCYFLWQEETKNSSIGIQEKVYNDWMRLTKNLINNTPIESPEDYKTAIVELKKLRRHITDIYEYIAKSGKQIRFFANIQKEEETLKAKLILKDKQWLPIFEIIETHPYFDGQIGFILKYAFKGDNEYSKKKFQDYSTKLMKLFGDDFKDEHEFIFIRALLSKGNYLVKFGANHSFCNFEMSLRAKTDNWRRVFNNDEKSLILRAFLDDIKSDDILSELDRIVKNSNTNDWRDIIIKNPEHLSYCKKKQIRFSDEKIYLISQTRMASRHYELFSYNLFLKDFDGTEYQPFSPTEYWKSTSYDEPCILLDCFMYEEYHFHMDIKHEGKYNYSIIFANRNNNTPKFPNEIITVLKELGFYFNKDLTHLIMKDIPEGKVKEKVKTICDALKRVK